MRRDQPFLSKSKYLTGLQCPKLLWFHYHAKEKIPPPDRQTQAIFDQGHQVNGVFQKLFPGGVMIQGRPGDYEGLVQKTRAALSLKKPLFEAAFRHKHSYARADVLKPNPDGSWDLFEVKSAASIKEINYEDVAFQKYCYEGAGIKLRKVHLVYINNEYVKEGAIDPAALFVREDVTPAAEKLAEEVDGRLEKMMEVIGQEECPDIKIGLQCGVPYECALKELCWAFLPEESVFVLNRIRKAKAFELIDAGVLHIKDVDQGYPFTPGQRIQWESHREGKTHADLPAIGSFLDGLKWPIHFLDLETVNPAIPFYDRSRPYQHVPFQFSLHILPGWDKTASHHAFLAEGEKDPRPELLSRLKSLLGGEGTLLAYNMSFERTRLRESVDAYPEYRDWFEGIDKRFADLIEPFRGFDYYTPGQMGRTSIKNVFPALTGGTYEGLGIADGAVANLEFARITFGGLASDEEKKSVRKNLEAYCKLDTQAMIDVLKVLKDAHGAG